jgi:hypothetical protein
MKKAIMSLTALAIAFASTAQNKTYPDKTKTDQDKTKTDKSKTDQDKLGKQNGQDSSKTYCFYLKDDGKSGMKTGDDEVKSDVKLKNGTVIKSDGTVMTKDGTKKVLKVNECLDANGEVIGSGPENPKKDDENDYDVPK